MLALLMTDVWYIFESYSQHVLGSDYDLGIVND